jgi:RNA polymerase sigma factor (sigma-70 family)
VASCLPYRLHSQVQSPFWLVINLSIPADQVAALIDRWAGPLSAWLRGRCSSPEDVVQGTFCQLVQEHQPPDRVAAWLFRVAGNLARQEARRTHRRRAREVCVALPELQSVDPSNSLELIDVKRCVESLPIELREVVIARLWGGLTFTEAAEALHLSVTTVHRRYSEAIAELRLTLDPDSTPTRESNARPTPH